MAQCIIKDQNSLLLKNSITNAFEIVFQNKQIDKKLVDEIYSSYSTLRDNLKHKLYSTQSKDEINKKNLDVHKVSACLTVAIFRMLSEKKIEALNLNIDSSIDLTYMRFYLGYYISCFFIKSSMGKKKNINSELPYFEVNKKYDEQMYVYLYNSEQEGSINRNIKCLLPISHMYYFIHELWYQQTPSVK